MIGDKLKALRLKAGLTLKDVFEKTGYAKSSIMSIERGNDPHLSTISKLAKTYGKTIKIDFQ